MTTEFFGLVIVEAALARQEVAPSVEIDNFLMPAFVVSLVSSWLVPWPPPCRAPSTQQVRTCLWAWDSCLTWAFSQQVQKHTDVDSHCSQHYGDRCHILRDS